MFRTIIIFVTSWFAFAASGDLITQRSSGHASTPVLDGIISTNEYGPGNGYAYTGCGTASGGLLEDTTLFMNSDSNHLFIALHDMAVPSGTNLYIIYMHTQPGGYQPNGFDMDDETDLPRQAVTRLSRDGAEYITFDNGETNAPDYALVLNNRNELVGGIVALYALSGAGTNHVAITPTWIGLGTSHLEIRIAHADIGTQNGSVIDFAMVNVSDDGFLSNEGIPEPELPANPGFSDGTTNVFPNFHRFNSHIASFSGIAERKENITLQMPDEPPASSNSYTTEDAFDGLSFNLPMHVSFPPGETNQLFVIERDGTIVILTNLVNPQRDIFMTVPNVDTTSEGGLQGIAFHPEYASNGTFFVFYTTSYTNGTGAGFHTRLSRFERNPTNSVKGVSNSETILFSQYNRSPNHNGGGMQFGPADGYLYVGVGDEGGANDSFRNSQQIDGDFFSGILRIDVDMKPGSLMPNHHPALNGSTNYAIPPDNPFIHATNYYGETVSSNMIRTELFATGIRNPFRLHIDDVTGDMYVGDVGQNAWEEVNLITNGGNYGWAGREGFGPGRLSFGYPASAYANPILAYGHGSDTNEGTSVTGGVVYRGSQYPGLTGKYVYADYLSGNIWALTHDGSTNISNPRITGYSNIVGIGSDPRNGDILLCTFNSGGQLRRLVQEATDADDFPHKLSDTGIFSDLNALTVFEGIVPYTIQLPFWSDNAIKTRWFSVPSTNNLLAFDPGNDWTAPTGTIWVKHFELLLTSGVPSSARRVETRVMVKTDAADGGYGVTYRWGDDTNDALLVSEEGMNEEFVINDSGIIRTQIWRYPSRSECLACHNVQAGFSLSFNTPQLNIENDFGDLATNQIAALDQAGYFSQPIESINLLRKIAHPTNDRFSVEARMRSYLEVNCAQCHFPGGITSGTLDARLLTPLSETSLIDGPLNDNGGDTNNRMVVRGDPAHSMLRTRMGFRGSGQMPPIGSNLVDTQGVALITAWITGEATDYETYEEWQLRHFSSIVSSNALPNSDQDGDGGNNRYEYLSRTQPTNAADLVDLNIRTDGDVPGVAFTKTAGAGFDLQVTTNLIDGTWMSLDAPENMPVFESSTSVVEIPDQAATNEAERYYRINVYEP